MSQTPLPPPPGFRRLAQRGTTRVRYVYQFSDSVKGQLAAGIHEDFLSTEDVRFRCSRFHALVEKKVRARVYPLLQKAKGSENKSRRFKIRRLVRAQVLFESSLLYPIFSRRDALDLVLEHVISGHRYYMKLDIADAFGSVYPGCHDLFPQVYKDETGVESFEESVYEWTGWPFFHPHQGGLIQGAPSSPHIFDQYCHEVGFDTALRSHARLHGWRVTRYVDDIVFSSPVPFSRQHFKTLRRLFAHYNFSLNETKSGRFDTHRKPIEFLGVSLYRNKVRPAQSFFERLKQSAFVRQGHLDWLARIQDVDSVLKKRFRQHNRARC